MAKIIATTGMITKGKLGDLVFYQWNGMNLVRCNASNFKDRKSKEQMVCRNAFGTVGKLYSTFKSAIRLNWKGVHKTPTSLFYKLNRDCIRKTETGFEIVYEKILLTNYEFRNLDGLVYEVKSEEIIFSWNKDHFLESKYTVVYAVYSKNLRRVFSTEVGRSSQRAVIPIPPDSGEVVTYCFGWKKSE